MEASYLSHDVVVSVLAWLHDYTLLIVDVVIQFSFITEQEWRPNAVIPGSFLSLALLDMVGRCCFTTVGKNLSLGKAGENMGPNEESSGEDGRVKEENCIR